MPDGRRRRRQRHQLHHRHHHHHHHNLKITLAYGPVRVTGRFRTLRLFGGRDCSAAPSDSTQVLRNGILQVPVRYTVHRVWMISTGASQVAPARALSERLRSDHAPRIAIPVSIPAVSVRTMNSSCLHMFNVMRNCTVIGRNPNVMNINSSLARRVT